jgi:hypothetical protein
MQMYANFCLLAAVTVYCFTDTGGEKFGKAAKILALVLVAAFVVTEAIALLT